MQSPFIVFPDTGIFWRSSRICMDEDIYNAYYSGAISRRDIEMLGFLARHKVATVSQLARACYAGKKKVGDRLRRFAGWRFLDSFSWVDGNRHTKPVVYCPGPGGIALLQEHNRQATAQVKLGGWHRRTAFDIAALLLANEFVLRAGTAVNGYTAEPHYKIGSAKLAPTAAFLAGETVLVMRVLRGHEHLSRFKSELPLYEQLIEGSAGLDKGGKRPVLLLVCESDRQALDLGHFIAARSTLTRYRFSTDHNILFKPPHLAFSTLEEGRLVVKAANIFKAPFDKVFHTSTTQSGLL